MNEWAIEAQDLVKKFPRRLARNSKSSPPLEAGQDHDSSSRRGWWPLKQRTATAWFAAVDGVNLQIQHGEIFGLLGPNGAGKTTTIRMLCTLLEPSSGTGRVNGFDILRQPNQVRQSLGTLLAGERSVYWKLTARENLEYFAALYHIPPHIARRRVDELLGRMELSDRADDLVEKFSTGMKQRLAISRSLLAQPPILMLDEPTLGLDPQAARRVRQLISELKDEGHTILLTTHYMEEADQLSDRIGIIDQGKIIALDTPAALKDFVRQTDVIRLEVAGWQADKAVDLQQLPGVEHLVTRYLGSDSLWEVNMHVASSRLVLPAVVESLSSNGTRLVNMNIIQPTMEDVFIHLTGKALRD